MVKKVVAALMVALYIWAGASFVNTITHNTNTQPNYANWNMFVLMTKGE